MNVRFLGDSYDIVKQSLLRWLSPLGPWTVHPMFTCDESAAHADEFSRLVGAPLLSRQVLTPTTDRSEYFSSARVEASHLFLDPDTGLRATVTRGAKGPSYLFLDELKSIAGRRAGALTLVFDQSIPRGSEARALEAKLAACKAEGLHALAYTSHACFLLVATEAATAARAYDTLRNESRLPETRFKVPSAE